MASITVSTTRREGYWQHVHIHIHIYIYIYIYNIVYIICIAEAKAATARQVRRAVAEPPVSGSLGLIMQVMDEKFRGASSVQVPCIEIPSLCWVRSPSAGV